MRSRWNLPIYLLYLAFSLAVIGFIVAQMGFPAPWAHPYSITATFSDAADILTNNEVLMNGTKVGHVGNVTVVNGQARVQLVIDNGHALPLHADASAEVRKKNLLGETYIDVQRGGSGNLSDGGSIPLSRTVPITEIDQVLSIFDPEAVQRLQLLINALGSATDNNGQNMNSEAESTDQLFSALNGPALELSVRQQQIQDIVLELQRFYGVIGNQRTQIRDEFGTWNQVMAELANQESSVAGTLQQGDALLQSLDRLVSGEGSNIKTVLSRLPAALNTANGFLSQADTVSSDLAPYRQYINDIFLGLHTSFNDKDPNGNHFWSVFSVNCTSPPISPSSCSGSAPTSVTAPAPADIWAAFSVGGTSR